MVRGKKPFERMIWAFKNVLSHTITWLFYDLKRSTDGSGPISLHHPRIIKVEPTLGTISGVEVPKFPQELEGDNHRLATELLEWLSLAMSSSPRIESHDNIDSYLSRYSAPYANDSASDPQDHNTQDLCSLHWHGLIPSIFIKYIFLAALKVSGTGWLGLSATSFDGRAYTFLQHQQNVMTWEHLD